MTIPALRLVFLCVAPLLFVCAPKAGDTTLPQDPAQDGAVENTINIHYLEIVTPDVDATCNVLSKAHGVTFSEPIAEFGNSRTASLDNGGRIGVRGPMRETETPVVRPYILVDDIEAAVEAAREAGGEIAIGPMEIPGQGMFAIYLLGGIEHGLWQN